MKRIIQAVLVDLNNVGEDYPAFAHDIEPSIRHVASHIAARFGGTADDIVSEVEEYSRYAGTTYLHHYPSVWQYVSERQAGRLLEHDEIEEVYGWYLQQYQQKIRIHGDFVPFLKRCRELGLRTGIVANGNARRISTFVDKFELRHLVNTVVSSGATPFKKPAIELFELALRNIGVSASDAVFVGDRPDTDILGANNAGMWSVRLLRGPSTLVEPRGPDEVPDAVIPDLQGFWSTELIRQTSPLDSAVIMAGGRGSRMKALTDGRQKCLLPDDDAPILGRVVNSLLWSGIRTFHFMLQYRPGDVVSFIQQRFPAIDAHFHEVDCSETGAAVASVLKALPARFIYSHGNIAVPPSAISRLIKSSHKEPRRTWFVATPRSDIAPTHPVFIADADRVRAIERHPPAETDGKVMYSLGLGVISQETLAPLGHAGSTTEQLWQSAPDAIRVLEHQGDWWHLENASDLERYRRDSQRWVYA